MIQIFLEFTPQDTTDATGIARNLLLIIDGHLQLSGDFDDSFGNGPRTVRASQCARNSCGVRSLEISAPDLIGYGAYCDDDTTILSLEDQAKHVIAYIEQQHNSPVHLLGHSVGGAISALVAMERPDIVASYTCVEGNFTLRDAFWSAQIAKKSQTEVEEIIQGYRVDPNAWMNEAVAEQSDLSSRVALEWLDNQPASTIKAQASAVVAATGRDQYLRNIRQVMESDMPVFLVAGVRSAAGWDTPDWANQLCNSRINIPGAGHLMMIESPGQFADAVKRGINQQMDSY